MSLFQGTASFYRQFRSGVPVEVATVLADAAPERHPRRLLDIGTGTGFVIEALQNEVDDVIGIDIDVDLLAVARTSVKPLPGQQVTFIEVRAEDFVPPAGWVADLVTICRTFHWLDRPLVLDRLDSMVAGDGVVAVLGDNSIWADNAGWKHEIKTVLSEFLGQDRRAGGGIYRRPAPYTDDLEHSPFSDWRRLTVPVRRERSLDSVIGYLHSTSFAAPHLFGDRLAEFDDALRDRLPPFAEAGVFVDRNEFGILLARRPG
ncbi:MAG TPA: methyltransferase domain-containing protein [Microlunatus sp.]|nr:methyltransferase domain-containing protein [Microlunatus sp.]